MTEWGLSGSYWREEHPFADVEARSLTRSLESGAGAMVSAMRYPTLFTACIQAFGWPLFMTTAAAEPERFAPILRRFAEISRGILAEWAAQSWPLILVHDDIAMQHGLVFRPQWYRQKIYPLYQYILEPVFDIEVR